MNSPLSSKDKTLLLQEAAKKIKYWNKGGVSSGSIDESPVQQGEVSSSNTCVLSSALFGAKLLETLNAFLFVVNAEGRIRSVTDNIDKILSYRAEQWYDKSIYEFLHAADHVTFSQALLLLLRGDEKEDEDESRTRVFSCRMKCKTVSDSQSSPVEAFDFLPMQISSLAEFDPTDENSSSSVTTNDAELYLVCVAQKLFPSANRQLPSLTSWHTNSSSAASFDLSPSLAADLRVGMSPVGLAATHTPIAAMTSNDLYKSTPNGMSGDHFTTQMNADLTVVSSDSSLLNRKFQNVTDFTGLKFDQFVHNNDGAQFLKHIDTVKSKTVGVEQNSSIYRLRITSSQYVFVQSKSQLINTLSGKKQILTKHYIVRECETNELKGSASTSLMNSIIQANNANGNNIRNASIPAAGPGGPPHSIPANHPRPSASSVYHLPDSSTVGVGGAAAASPAAVSESRAKSANSSNMTLMSSMQNNHGLQDLNFNDLYSANATNWSSYDVPASSWSVSPVGSSNMQPQHHSMSLYNQQSSQPVPSHQPQLTRQLSRTSSDHHGKQQQQMMSPVAASPYHQHHHQSPVHHFGSGSLQSPLQSLPVSSNASHRQHSLQRNTSITSLPPSSIDNKSASDSTGLSTGHGKLMQLLSAQDPIGDNALTRISNVTPTSAVNTSVTQTFVNQDDEVLKRLLQADDDPQPPYPLTHSSMGPQSISSSTICSIPTQSDSSRSMTATNTTTCTTSSVNKAPDHPQQHQLLKKLLSEDNGDEADRSEKPNRLLKFLREEDKEQGGGSKRSPVAQSPATPSSTASRRHSSGSSNKEVSTNKQAQSREESHRGTKRKASTSSFSSSTPAASAGTPASSTTVTLASSSISNSEADSTASGNTNLLSQLLTKPTEAGNKAVLKDVSSSPYNKVKRDIANVVDVVNDKIVHGQDIFNMEKFTSLKAKHPGHPPHLSGSAAADMQIFQHNSRPSNLLQQPHNNMYMNNSSYGSSLHNNIHSPNSPIHPYDNSNRQQAYDFGMGGQLGLQAHNGFSNSPSADDQITRSLLSEEYQDVISLLLGESSTNSTSAEDQQAILDIQQQLLLSSEYIPGLESSPHSHSPLTPLTNVPAIASNPSNTTALMTINHMPVPGSELSDSPYSLPVASPPMNQIRSQLGNNVRGVTGPAGRGRPRAPSRQNSSIRPPQSPAGGIRMRKLSGSSSGGFQSSYNLNDLMKTTPPNMSLPADLAAGNSFPRSQVHPDYRNSRDAPFSPMDIPSSPQLSSYPPERSMSSYGPPTGGLQRRMSGGPSPNYPADMYSINSHPAQQHMYNNNQMARGQLHSPMDSMDSNQLNAQYNNNSNHHSIDQLSNMEQNHLIKQEMKAKITAKIQQQQQQQQQQQRQQQMHSNGGMIIPNSMAYTSTSQTLHVKPATSVHSQQPPSYNDRQHMSSLSNSDDLFSNGIPDDILEQISAMEGERNMSFPMSQSNDSIQQPPRDSLAPTGKNISVSSALANSNNEQDSVSNRINRTKMESTQVREQLRALANSGTNNTSPPARTSSNTLDNVFRTQLTQSTSVTTHPTTSSSKAKPKSTGISRTEVERLKRTPSANISIINVHNRPEVADIHPQDQSHSLLQKLLTE